MNTDQKKILQVSAVIRVYPWLTVFEVTRGLMDAVTGMVAALPVLAADDSASGKFRHAIRKREREVSLRVAGGDMAFCFVPAGRFVMGSRGTEIGHDQSESPARTVRQTPPFYLSKFQVTQAQFKAITGTNPSGIQGHNLP